MTRRGTALGASALAFTMATALAGGALAQEPALQPAPAPTPAPATAGANGQAEGSVAAGGSAQGSGAMTLPPPPAAAAPAADPAPARVAPGNSEHDQMVGTLAIGYLGSRSMIVGCNGGGEPTQPGAACAGTLPRETLNAPVIGVRYWISDLVGIDAGLGMAINSLSGNNGQNRPSSTAFLIHGGVPLALASTGHFAFEIIPEMNIGFSSWTQNTNGSGSGFHFDIGARAGAEIHFGFIGIPQLSLLGTIGLAFALDSAKANPAGGAPSVTQTDIAFGTSVQDNPWNIFTSNVAALYYF